MIFTKKLHGRVIENSKEVSDSAKPKKSKRVSANNN
jgi:hypothetical protein